MNRTILMDKLWRIYFLLPHCQFNMKRNRAESRKEFNYEKNSDISLITANCIGGEIYSILGLPFRSPLINTAMNRKQFITMCQKLKEYMELPLRLSQPAEGVLIGKLGNDLLPDVEIHFDHDNDPQTVLEKWERRKKRINWEKIILICDDKDIDEEDYERFDRIIGYSKIMLTALDLSDRYLWAHQLKPYANQGKTGAYNGKSYKGGWKFQYMWNFVEFLNKSYSS